MRILQICSRVPYPLHDGRAIGIFNITKHLALRGHQIQMVAFAGDESTSLNGLRQCCDLTTVRHDTETRWIHAFLNLSSKVPYTISKYKSDLMLRKIAEIVENSTIDVVHVDHLHMAVYGVFLKERYRLPIVLREHNIESTIMERFALNQKNPFLRRYAALQHQKLLRYEPEVCAKFDRCVVITLADEQRMRALSNGVRCTIIPAGVDLPDTASRVPELPKSILFMASLDWPPNVEGFFWFYDHVLPIVLREEPDMLLSIVGKGDSPRLRQLRHPNVRFIGFVDDVVSHLQAAQACIVPLLTGGGMRIKILEMFAHRKCVVSTSIGCEGIEAGNRRELLIADDATDFAESLLCALRDESLRRALGKNARRLVEEKYDWHQIGAAFERVYSEVIKNQ